MIQSRSLIRRGFLFVFTLSAVFAFSSGLAFGAEEKKEAGDEDWEWREDITALIERMGEGEVVAADLFVAELARSKVEWSQIKAKFRPSQDKYQEKVNLLVERAGKVNWPSGFAYHFAELAGASREARVCGFLLAVYGQHKDTVASFLKYFEKNKLLEKGDGSHDDAFYDNLKDDQKARMKLDLVSTVKLRRSAKFLKGQKFVDSVADAIDKERGWVEFDDEGDDLKDEEFFEESKDPAKQDVAKP